VVPAALDADLDDVEGGVGFRSSDRADFGLGGERATARRQPGAEREGDVDELRLFADRTGVARRDSEVGRYSHQLGLRIADIEARQATSVVFTDDGVTCEEVLDPSESGDGWSSGGLCPSPHG
jgi:hypothetical protein